MLFISEDLESSNGDILRLDKLPFFGCISCTATVAAVEVRPGMGLALDCEGIGLARIAIAQSPKMIYMYAPTIILSLSYLFE